MPRYAAIDIGTNSVLLLVAERNSQGRWVPVAERAEITRLGRGVDKTRKLAPEAIEDTVAAVTTFCEEARSLGAAGIVASATSAARDASNGADFLNAVKQRAGIDVEIISGDLEARLSFATVYEDFAQAGTEPLVCIDIGGGSTELIFGGEGTQRSELVFRKSFDVGSVRLTERFVKTDPPGMEEQEALVKAVDEAFSELPAPAANTRVVGVAGTVTTLYTVLHGIDPYDAQRVQGGALTVAELSSLRQKLFSLPLADRRQLPGLPPKRADVICAGAIILERLLMKLGARECTVSDRGLRWGLLAQRFSQT
jgi:exopolyphosphatase/guanosine-5'-triphosphate,3'-diphosphate pyrophosphatase